MSRVGKEKIPRQKWIGLRGPSKLLVRLGDVVNALVCTLRAVNGRHDRSSGQIWLRKAEETWAGLLVSQGFCRSVAFSGRRAATL